MLLANKILERVFRGIYSIQQHIFYTTFVCGQKNRPGQKKRCDVLDETLGLYEICLQVTQQRKMVCVCVTKLCVKDGVCESGVCVCVCVTSEQM